MLQPRRLVSMFALVLLSALALAAKPSVENKSTDQGTTPDASSQAQGSLAPSAGTALHTYLKPDGSGYFALSLTPSQMAKADPAPREIVILFDTSASQFGQARVLGMKSLEALLKHLNPEDRVQLLAIDLTAVPMTTSFVAPESDALQDAVKKLQRRVPLGATDLPLTLRKGAALFSAQAADRKAVVKTILYIGDGVSAAHWLISSDFAELTKELVAAQLPVSSYCVGPRCDAQILAALANHTGGVLVVDGEKIEPKEAGIFLATSVDDAAIVWPTSVTWPKAFSQVYPDYLPPLRSDRDTVVIGAGKMSGTVEVSMKGKADGRPVQHSWTIAASASTDDYSYLSTLVEAAAKDQGVTLPTLGTLGLEEMGRVIVSGTQGLTQLGSQALASGNLDGAQRMAEEALRRDPNDPEALTLKRSVEKTRVAETKAEQLTLKGSETPAKQPMKKAGRKSTVKKAAVKTSQPKKADTKDQSLQAFAVADDLILGPKKKSAAATSPSKSAIPSKTTTPPTAAPAGKAAQVKNQPNVARPAAAAVAAKAPRHKPKAIHLKIPEGTSPVTAWSEYFATHDDVSPDDVRETARRMMAAKQFDQVTAMIRGALEQGAAESWMYEGLALAMRAAGEPNEEIERALMSAVDFSDNLDDLLYVAQYLARFGLEQRAMQVFQQVATLDPTRHEPYIYGLQLATRLDDLEGIKWASLGILGQAWPKDKREIEQSAKLAAQAVLDQLNAEKRFKEAAEFRAKYEQALVRDCVVTVTWTGDADLDLMIEEPSGTICSLRNPRTTSGGMLLGDTLVGGSTKGQAGKPAGSFSETYVCPHAFSGNYRLLVRRIWGKVTAGKVDVDVYAHYGTKELKHFHHQMPIGDEDVMAQFELDKGRRTEPLGEQQVANAAAGQLAVNQAILAQQINSAAAATPATSSIDTSRAGFFSGLPFIRQAVGYQPVIIQLPAGANFSVTAVVSADRRYVRVSPSPFFSQIGQVTTFNIASGDTTTQPAPPSGGGGVSPPPAPFPTPPPTTGT